MMPRLYISLCCAFVVTNICSYTFTCITQWVTEVTRVSFLQLTHLSRFYRLNDSQHTYEEYMSMCSIKQKIKYQFDVTLRRVRLFPSWTLLREWQNLMYCGHTFWRFSQLYVYSRMLLPLAHYGLLPYFHKNLNKYLFVYTDFEKVKLMLILTIKYIFRRSTV